MKNINNDSFLRLIRLLPFVTYIILIGALFTLIADIALNLMKNKRLNELEKEYFEVKIK